MPILAPILVVAPDSRWFELPGEPRVDIARRQNLRRILAALIDAHERDPGLCLDSGTLFAAGWPGERAVQNAATNRVRVAIATLRKLGLREAVVTEPGGYRLAPALRVERTGD